MDERPERVKNWCEKTLLKVNGIQKTLSKWNPPPPVLVGLEKILPFHKNDSPSQMFLASSI